jgi:F-type H+-transporting ATPase subunit epsilon
MASHPTSTAGEAKGDELHCVVVTPERTLFDERVDFVALPLFDGEIGILPGRSPLIGRLGFGELRTRVGDSIARYFVDGGFVQVRDNIVTVLTHRAIPGVKLRADAAMQELEKAQARVAKTDLQEAEKQKALARARAQIRLASKVR